MRLPADEFEKLVREALDSLPPQFRSYLDGVAVDVEPAPDPQAKPKPDRADRHRQLGLYHGTPLTERSVEFVVRFPDRIVIYQRNLERMCRSRRRLAVEIRRTLLHEIGHHFGLDEDDLAELGWD